MDNQLPNTNALDPYSNLDRRVFKNKKLLITYLILTLIFPISPFLSAFFNPVISNGLILAFSLSPLALIMFAWYVLTFVIIFITLVRIFLVRIFYKTNKAIQFIFVVISFIAALILTSGVYKIVVSMYELTDKIVPPGYASTVEESIKKAVDSSNPKLCDDVPYVTYNSNGTTATYKPVDECYNQIAMNTKNVELCRGGTGVGIGNLASCLLQTSQNPRVDYKYCLTIGANADSYAKEHFKDQFDSNIGRCYGQFASKINDSSICIEVSDQYNGRSLCFVAFARTKHDSRVCSNITGYLKDYYTNSCIKAASEATTNQE